LRKKWQGPGADKKANTSKRKGKGRKSSAGKPRGSGNGQTVRPKKFSCESAYFSCCSDYSPLRRKEGALEKFKIIIFSGGLCPQNKLFSV